MYKCKPQIAKRTLESQLKHTVLYIQIVKIIIAARAAGKHLKTCVESISRQTLGSFSNLDSRLACQRVQRKLSLHWTQKGMAKHTNSTEANNESLFEAMCVLRGTLFLSSLHQAHTWSQIKHVILY